MYGPTPLLEAAGINQKDPHRDYICFHGSRHWRGGWWVRDEGASFYPIIDLLAIVANIRVKAPNRASRQS